MSQAALAFDTPATDTAAAALPSFDRTGFDIGWDHARWRVAPPAGELRAGHAVRHGWQAGRTAFGPRARAATPARRHWLALRLQAWRDGQAFDDMSVTPHLLQQLEVSHCPVTRLALTHDTGTGTDAVIVRLHAGAGWAAGNLAMLSVTARQALEGRSVAELGARARDAAATPGGELDGLAAPAWHRLAALAACATPLPHAEAAVLPMAALPPNRCRVLNPVQALQAVVTLAFTRSEAVPRLRELIAHLPAAARHDFQVFLVTMQARRLAIGMRTEGLALRQALEDVWTDAAVNRRWQRFALQLTEADCERVVRIAARRGRGGHGWQWLPAAAATDGWSLGEPSAAKPPVKAPFKRSLRSRATTIVA